MSIIDRPTQNVKPTALTIRGESYLASRLNRPRPTVRVVKEATGGVYDITLHEGRPVCSCPDYRQRRANSGSPCKHGRAVIASGLLALRPGVDRVRDEFDAPDDPTSHWPAWTDSTRYGLGPAAPLSGDDALDTLEELGHLNGLDDLDELPLHLYLEGVRSHFARLDERTGSGAVHLVMEALDDLIAESRILGRPQSLDTFIDRREAMNASR